MFRHAISDVLLWVAGGLQPVPGGVVESVGCAPLGPARAEQQHGRSTGTRRRVAPVTDKRILSARTCKKRRGSCQCPCGQEVGELRKEVS
jgi:hypothetical protein